MPDFIDQMQESDALTFQAQENIARIQREAAKAPTYFKFCRNCGEATEGGAAFCDMDCCSDYERIQRARGQRR